MLYGPKEPWKPWWAKTADFDTQHEKEEFLRGVVGPKPLNKQAIVTGILAGYIGGRIAAKRGRRD